MDQTTPEGGQRSEAECVADKRPWVAPTLKRLDIGLTSNRGDNLPHHTDSMHTTRS
jgi:hypothetical protein